MSKEIIIKNNPYSHILEEEEHNAWNKTMIELHEHAQNEAMDFKKWCDSLTDKQKIKSTFKFMITEYTTEELYHQFKNK